MAEPLAASAPAVVAPPGAAAPRGVAVASAAWREMRPAVQVMFLLRLLCGAALAAGAVPDRRSALGAAAWCLVVAAIYLRNGASDVVEDRRNGSLRPVAAGVLPADVAAGGARGLATAGLLLAAVHGTALLAAAGAMAGLGWAYSTGPRPLKNSVPGFVGAVVGGGALTYVDGCVVVHGTSSTALVGFGLGMSLWIGLAGATKDLSDVAGDAAAGRRTLPVRLGHRRASVVMAVGVLAVGTAFLAGSVCLVPLLLPSAGAVAAGAGLVAVLLVRSTEADGRRALRGPYRAFMVTQYAAHLLTLCAIVAPTG